MADLLSPGALKAILSRAVELRHDIHRHPETALEEHRTRERLLAFLGDGFRFREPLIGTDLVAELPGKDDSACIALRADMDGLSLNEESGVPWASAVPGKMHACGHDGHMAILAATARMLAEAGFVPPLTVRFVFQPGEEVVGAGRRLAELGAYEEAKAAFALHGWPGTPIGSIALKEGLYFGASHNFFVSFRGRGGHGAYPDRAVNPLPAAARAVTALDALNPGLDIGKGDVVSVCSLQGGHAANVIPGEARLMGTVRYTEPESGRNLEAEIRRILEESVAGTGVELDLDYDRAYEVPLVNHPDGCRIIRNAAGGQEPVIPVVEEIGVERGSEDFAYALDRVPGALFKLGIGDGTAPLHSSSFDFPDEALETGIRMMGRLAMGSQVKAIPRSPSIASSLRPYST